MDAQFGVGGGRITRRSTTLLICVLIASLMLSIIVHVVQTSFLRDRGTDRARNVSTLLLNEFERYYFGRGDQLAAYCPPKSKAMRLAWAESIATGFRQPAAVFAQDASGFAWYSSLPNKAFNSSHWQSLMQQSPTGHWDVGSLRIERYNPVVDSTSFVGWSVLRIEDSLRWGAVFEWQDSWRAFFQSLSNRSVGIREVQPLYSSSTLKDVVQLTESTSTQDGNLTLIKAYLGNEIVFSSPGYASSRKVYQEQLGPVTISYYDVEKHDPRTSQRLFDDLYWLLHIGLTIAIILTFNAHRKLLV